MQDLIFHAILVMVMLILSLTVHEFAHAFMAWKLGDDTPRLQGRLTLNPLPHIHPIGTLLLPLACLFFQTGLFFGFARPVQVTLLRVSHSIRMVTGDLLISLAGPLANLILAYSSVGVYIALKMALPEVPQYLLSILSSLVLLNILLAVFNLLPIPPLDGSRVLFSLLPRGSERTIQLLQSVSPVLFFLLIFKGSFLIWPLIQAVVVGMDWLTQGQTTALFLSGLPDAQRWLLDTSGAS